MQLALASLAVWFLLVLESLVDSLALAYMIASALACTIESVLAYMSALVLVFYPVLDAVLAALYNTLALVFLVDLLV
jgi:hypothetical protein